MKTEEQPGNLLEELPLWEQVELVRGEVLCQPGEPANALYFVRSGRVELHPEGDRTTGDPLSRRVVGPGEFFGEVDLARTVPSPLTYTARALEDATLLRIDGQGLAHQVKRRRGRGSLRLKRLLGCGDQLVFLC